MICDPYKQTSYKPLYIDEQMIYGSSRIGVLDRSSLNLTGDDIIKLSKDGTVLVEEEARRNILSDKSTSPGIVPVTDKVVYSQSTHTLGLKNYELTNHLGNVLTTVSDRKNTVATGQFTAEIISSQDYYPFGSLMPGRKYSSNSYRFGFNGQEKDDEFDGVAGSKLDFGERVFDSRISRFFKVDGKSSSFPWWSPYQFAGNSPISGIDLDGLEYLNYYEARIKMVGGVAHINLENFNSVTRGAWEQRDKAGNWPTESIGYPTAVAQMSIPSMPPTAESASLDNTYGAVDPAYNPTQHNVQNPIAKSTGLPDKRYKSQTVSGASGMSKGGSVVMLAVNAINWAFENYGSFKMAEDKQLVNEHLSILQKQVANDLNEALAAGMIPPQYQNVQDMGNIANVILSGVNPTDNQDIYDIGIDIVKKISGNYRHPIKLISTEVQEGQDNTAVRKTFVVPIVEEEEE